MDQHLTVQYLIFSILYGGVIATAVIASLYLLLRRNNAFSSDINSPLRLRRWTAAFFAIIVLGHLIWLLIYYIPHDLDIFYRAIICSFFDVVVTMPFLLCTMLAMLQDRRRPLWPVALIVVLTLAELLVVYILGNRLTVVTILLFVTILLAITIPMTRAVRQYGRWLRDNYADLEHKEVWQGFVMMAVFLLISVSYSLANDYFVFEVLIEVSDIILIFFLLWRVETLQQLEVPAAEHSAADQEETEKGTEGAEEAADNLSYIGERLEKYCEAKQFYLNHDVSVYQLAEQIGTNRKYLGRYFSQHGITYNTYINRLRISHFVRRYEQAVAENREVTATQLFPECGFSSYSTFSAAFKQVMGQTVNSWMHS
ncbi:MAG: AraC family transcriptional regulator [Prevotella sp.]|nr:AraC family transcriptional regulator [Prevotella sp.]